MYIKLIYKPFKLYLNISDPFDIIYSYTTVCIDLEFKSQMFTLEFFEISTTKNKLNNKNYINRGSEHYKMIIQLCFLDHFPLYKKFAK